MPNGGGASADWLRKQQAAEKAAEEARKRAEKEAAKKQEIADLIAEQRAREEAKRIREAQEEQQRKEQEASAKGEPPPPPLDIEGVRRQKTIEDLIDQGLAGGYVTVTRPDGSTERVREAGGDLNIDLAGAAAAGFTDYELRNLGFDAETVQDAVSMAPFVQPGGGVDLPKAILAGENREQLVETFGEESVAHAEQYITERSQRQQFITDLQEYREGAGYDVAEAVAGGMDRDELIETFGEDAVNQAETFIAQQEWQEDILNRLEDYREGAGYRIIDAIDDGIITESEALEVGFTGPDLILARATGAVQRRAARDVMEARAEDLAAIGPYRTGEGYDIAAFLADGGDVETLNALGFSPEDIQAAISFNEQGEVSNTGELADDGSMRTTEPPQVPLAQATPALLPTEEELRERGVQRGGFPETFFYEDHLYQIDPDGSVRRIDVGEPNPIALAGVGLVPLVGSGMAILEARGKLRDPEASTASQAFSVGLAGVSVVGDVFSIGGLASAGAKGIAKLTGSLAKIKPAATTPDVAPLFQQGMTLSRDAVVRIQSDFVADLGRLDPNLANAGRDLLGASEAYADNLAQAQGLRTQIANTESELAKVRGLPGQSEVKQHTIAELEGRINRLNNQLDTLQTPITESEAALRSAAGEYATSLREGLGGVDDPAFLESLEDLSSDIVQNVRSGVQSLTPSATKVNELESRLESLTTQLVAARQKYPTSPSMWSDLAADKIAAEAELSALRAGGVDAMEAQRRIIQNDVNLLRRAAAEGRELTEAEIIQAQRYRSTSALPAAEAELARLNEQTMTLLRGFDDLLEGKGPTLSDRGGGVATPTRPSVITPTAPTIAPAVTSPVTAPILIPSVLPGSVSAPSAMLTPVDAPVDVPMVAPVETPEVTIGPASVPIGPVTTPEVALPAPEVTTPTVETGGVDITPVETPGVDVTPVEVPGVEVAEEPLTFPRPDVSIGPAPQPDFNIGPAPDTDFDVGPATMPDVSVGPATGPEVGGFPGLDVATGPAIAPATDTSVSTRPSLRTGPSVSPFVDPAVGPALRPDLATRPATETRSIIRTKPPTPTSTPRPPRRPRSGRGDIPELDLEARYAKGDKDVMVWQKA